MLVEELEPCHEPSLRRSTDSKSSCRYIDDGDITCKKVLCNASTLLNLDKIGHTRLKNHQNANNVVFITAYFARLNQEKLVS